MRLKKTSFFSLLFIAFTLISCGGGVSGENGSDPFGSGNSDTSSGFKLGYFNSQRQFIEGKIGISTTDNDISQVSAGGSIGLSVVVVDQDNQRVQTSTLVTFTSACVIAEEANITTEVSTVNGQASNTFIDLGCGGAGGTSDEISASITTTDTTIKASGQINILPDAIGGVKFVSVDPATIFLNGAGDIGQIQTLVTFIVTNEQGLALEEQAVSFSLTTEIGGLTLSTTQAISNIDGEVSTLIIAGGVPTAVRVNAMVIGANGEIITTQSEAISVTTGLPNQYSFSLAKNITNAEGADRDGEEVNFEARLSDTFGNPVPDNTLINFTAEGGQIESSCATIDGACNVVWVSSNPRVDNGVITILATAIGHETLFDSNGNNVYDQDDGEAIDDNSDRGVFIAHPTGTIGFVDISEAWRDDNDNGMWDTGEIFLDYDNDGEFNEADGFFNGTQCTHPTKCGQGNAATLHVRKSARLIVSGSYADIDVFNISEVLLASNNINIQNPIEISIARGATAEFNVNVSDVRGNIMPANTSVNLTSTEGVITILTGTTVPNAFSTAPSRLVFSMENNLTEDDNSVTSRLSVVVSTPSGAETNFEFRIQLQ